MKIAFLTPEYPHSKTGISGGIGTSILNLSKGLKQLGHEVSILVYGQTVDAYFEEDGIAFYQIKNVKVKGLSLFFTQRKILKLINSLVSKGLVELVEAPDWTGITSFIKPNCPVVIRENGSDTYFCHLDQRKVKWTNTFLEKRALQQCDGLIAVSNYTGTLTKKLFQLQSDFTVIPNAIDATQFSADSIGSSKATILYFGTLIRKKGLLELPLIFNEVVKKNPHAQLLLVGKDASDIATQSKSTWDLMVPLFDKQAFQNVSYIGSLPYTEIKKMIQQATVCVFPTFAEALPVSWLEAMAMQKPIVASSIGWASEIVDDGVNGFLELPNAHVNFASKINILLDDVGLQKQFGIEARKKILSHFNIDVVAAKSIAFYKNYL